MIDKKINMIYGTAWKKEQTSTLVEQAILTGFKAVDTACQPKHYREDLVGIGLENVFKNSNIRREDIFIQTKFTPIDGQDKTNMPYLESDEIEIQVEKSFEISKKNLKTDFINSYILHSPVYPGSKFQRVWQKMEEFYDKKEVGQLGISNCYDLDVLKYLYTNATVKPKVVQNRFYPQSGYDKTIREFCNENEIIYQSFWSLTANPHLLSSFEIIEIAKKYEKTVAQIFYKFLNKIEITPLNGTTSKTHMIEDLDIVNFDLNEEEVKKILNLI